MKICIVVGLDPSRNMSVAVGPGATALTVTSQPEMADLTDPRADGLVVVVGGV
jgi:hypothetical protein